MTSLPGSISAFWHLVLSCMLVTSPFLHLTASFCSSCPRLCGHQHLARKVEAGYTSFLITNTPNLDRNHRFSTTHLRRLAAALHPSEQAEYMLFFEPGNGNTVCPSPKEMARLSSSSSLEEKVQHMRNVPCDLGTQTLNICAFLWKKLFGLEVPYEAVVKSETIKGQLGFKGKQDVVLKHCFFPFA